MASAAGRKAAWRGTEARGGESPPGVAKKVDSPSTFVDVEEAEAVFKLK